MKVLIRSALVVIMYLLAPSAAMACYCLTPEVGEAFEKSRAIFQGEVVETIPPRNTNKDAPFTDRAWTIRFKVERTWKGPFFIEADVYQLRDECFSLPPLMKGEKYLVYAESVSGSTKSTDVFISVCNRTVSMSETATDIRLFRPELVRTAERDIRALNGLMIMPGKKPSFDPVPWMNFFEP